MLGVIIQNAKYLNLVYFVKYRYAQCCGTHHANFVQLVLNKADTLKSTSILIN
jgi:hypothetical protein